MNQTIIQSDLLKEAAEFIHNCYNELGLSDDQKNKRITQINDEIEATGTYTHETFEIVHGA